MSRAVQIEEDGTRVYKSGKRYKPKGGKVRAYNTRKPEDPRAVYWYGKWILPLDLLPDESRPALPETMPDETAYDHWGTRPSCGCPPCRRPQAAEQRRRWERHHL